MHEETFENKNTRTSNFKVAALFVRNEFYHLTKNFFLDRQTFFCPRSTATVIITQLFKDVVLTLETQFPRSRDLLRVDVNANFAITKATDSDWSNNKKITLVFNIFPVCNHKNSTSFIK